jgi:periplasmic protein TonB
VNAASPSLPLEVWTDWYRQPSVKVAFLLSLLVHAAAITLLPGMRVPTPSEPVAMVVELAPMAQPALSPAVSEPKPVPKPVLQPPAPVLRPPPPVPEKPPEPPPVITRVVPQPEAPPELRVAPQPEARVEPKTAPEPRVEATPPPVPQPRLEPPQARVEPQPPPKVEATAPQPPSAPDPALLKAYGSVLAQAIGRRKNYPRLARIRNWQGTAELRLQIGTDGALKGLTVTHSSGFPVLDEQAVTMVKETIPLPEMPEALRGREFAITVPVVFRLE